MMEYDENNKFQAFVCSGKQLYIDDTHYGCVSQLLEDKGIDCENAIFDEYVEISKIDKEAIFGEFQKFNGKVFPIILTNNADKCFIVQMKKCFKKCFGLTEDMNLYEI